MDPISPARRIRVIITGSTGMVGEGVLHECLNHPAVERVLLVNRKPLGAAHPKLTELVHADFFDLAPLREQLSGYDACFFCLGVSSVGMSEEAYRRLTYTLTLQTAELLAGLNPGMVFAYVSGAGTDSSERGRSMWARVKGRTENDLRKLPFKAVYLFRPGYLHPTPGLRNTHGYYRAIGWLFPLLRRLFPSRMLTLGELGTAMIRTALDGSERPVLETADIARLARG